MSCNIQQLRIHKSLHAICAIETNTLYQEHAFLYLSYSPPLIFLFPYRSYLSKVFYLPIMLLLLHARWFLIVIEMIERLEWRPGTKNVMVEVPLDVPELVLGVNTSGNGEDLVELFQGIAFGFLLFGQLLLGQLSLPRTYGKEEQNKNKQESTPSSAKIQLSVMGRKIIVLKRYSLPSESTLRSKGSEQPRESQRHDEIEKPSGSGSQ